MAKDNDYYFNPRDCHQFLLNNIERKLAFDPEWDFTAWQQEMGRILKKIIGDMPDEVPLNIRTEYDKKRDGYQEKKFVFPAEKYADIPCHLLIPEGKGPFPVIITLQGHSSGMYLSLGEVRKEGDRESLAGDRDFALQAVENGYAALVMEQRCFGEREDNCRKEGSRCHQAAMTALLLGRTMIGERVWDVMRAIDVLESFPEIDNTKIGLMGNSGGGTIAYYASCLEPRINAVMPSCAICRYKDSIGSI
ncbi:MAG: alpha/beta hydrolase family protein, partial [Halanaerobiales bacterium]